jgi:DNA-binding MarR family transcriptional regulator
MYLMLDDRDLSECGDCLCLASRRAARSITRAFDRKLRASGLRATQFTILVMVARAGPLSIGHLADALGAERTTLTRNLALIEAKRWVQIRPGDDARLRVVSITPKGRAAVEAALPAWRAAQAAAAAAIGQTGVSTLHAMSRRFTKHWVC